MNALEKLDLPWEVISLIGLDKITPGNMHLYNAVLYGLAERYKQHGFEWVKEHAQEIRTQICAASYYAGENICGKMAGNDCWSKACSDAAELLNSSDENEPADCDGYLNTEDADADDMPPASED